MRPANEKVEKEKIYIFGNRNEQESAGLQIGRGSHLIRRNEAKQTDEFQNSISHCRKVPPARPAKTSRGTYSLLVPATYQIELSILILEAAAEF